MTPEEKIELAYLRREIDAFGGPLVRETLSVGPGFDFARHALEEARFNLDLHRLGEHHPWRRARSGMTRKTTTKPK